MGELVCSTMEGAIELSVPLRVELKTGKNWGEMQPLQAAGQLLLSPNLP